MGYYSYNELYHHGIKGQKWGVRRFRNEDGTLTEAGKRKYYDKDGKLNKAGIKYNKKQREKFDRYKNAVKYTTLKVNKDKLEKLYNEYASVKQNNKQNFKKSHDDWVLNNPKKYKDYYDFKDKTADEYFKSNDGKRQIKLEKEIRQIFDSSAKEHPLYNKSFDRLLNTDYSDLIEDYKQIKKVNFGEQAVKEIMSNLNNAAYNNKSLEDL